MCSNEAAVMARYGAQGWRLPNPSEAIVMNNNSDGGEVNCGIRCYFADEVDQHRRRRRQQRQATQQASTSFEEDDDRMTDEEEELRREDDDEEDLNELNGDIFGYLAPPKPEKLFLLSPPASPPVGWAPRVEAEPVINYDLLHALASLEPGKAHELHPPEKDQPSIVVTPCEGVATETRVGAAVKIIQTACPPQPKPPPSTTTNNTL